MAGSLMRPTSRYSDPFHNCRTRLVPVDDVTALQNPGVAYGRSGLPAEMLKARITFPVFVR
jgi:hypothetical protein